MRLGAAVAASALLAISCSLTSGPAASQSGSPARTNSPAPADASPVLTSRVPQTASYGLLLSAGTLAMVTPAGQVGATASLASPSLQTCMPGLGPLLAPPVSATADRVYFRDGDTKIRYLTPTGQTGDATTVPGGTTSISFFSVSPDDQRIAVLVEDFLAATTIGERLYVEDLNGGGNHVDLYATATAKGPNATTLWPMGWHQGQLVLALIVACTNEPLVAAPSEWHVASASTGNRIATIKGVGNCIFSRWPSAAGVACVDTNNLTAGVYDWTGQLTLTTPTPPPNSLNAWHSGLSPSGQRIFFSTLQGLCQDVCPAFHTDVNSSFRQGTSAFATQYDATPACLWIDETHLLSNNGVISLQQTGSNPTVTSNKPLSLTGDCAGRYPGGL